MPKRPPRPCAVPGCPELVYEGSRCDKHRLQRPPDNRPNATRRGYGFAWQKKRKAWLEKHPWCVDLYGIHHEQKVKAIIVDHIVPLRQGGRDDETNYQSLCVTCNNRKTARDGSRRGGRGG